jgi:transcriptional regulator with XRE-family HTH domain
LPYCIPLCDLYGKEGVFTILIKKRIGDRIRELRNKIGLSQEKFALEIDMDRTYLASVESGKRNISIVNLEKIVKGLDITFMEFFKGIEK